ncbi:thymidine kinase [Candidatus Blochmanniella vafra str. BVAF]|uniref:Thymidine kinase n=1 Tax=Blochmanniella vafra (strain BVAF) TaxID=859654 RepID=E8Q6D0_BLOVB|nr:thymidine kinase [Candidatus Blochmannia vafer]ADV33824.1 thymidine kinase [Candidatus Blochmannia vafer str. BVAF]
MAKLYFYYSAMNAGKTTALLQSSYNYQERGMHTLLYTAQSGSEKIAYKSIQSRVGLTAYAKIISDNTNLFEQISAILHKKIIHCVLVDECHFLSRNQVLNLTEVVDILNIPVLCYGLRTDFRSELFSGSLWLLAWADKLIELKTVCYCGRQANRVLRVDNQGVVIKEGNQIMIGSNKHYISVCRKHFSEKFQSTLPVLQLK